MLTSRARSRGYALDREENESGVHYAAVAVTLGTGTEVAAVSVTVPTSRLAKAKLDSVGLDLMRATRHLLPGRINRDESQQASA